MKDVSISSLENMKLKELYELARHYKISYYSKLTKKELIFAILKANAEQEDLLFMEGVLEIIQSEGFGFLNRSTTLQAQRTFTSQLHKSAVSICGTETKYRARFARQKKMSVTMDFCTLKQ